MCEPGSRAGGGTSANKSQSVGARIKRKEERVAGRSHLHDLSFRRKGQLGTLTAVGQVIRCW